MFKVELSREAQRFYDRADKPTAKKLARCFEALETDPRAGNNVKPLKGKFTGSYRYRVGDLRVVYTVNDQAVTVFVITIAKRSDVYE
jgi:mRNA interferase RelE/StbE